MPDYKVKKVSQKRYDRLQKKADKNPAKFESKLGEGILKNSKKLFTLKTPEYTEAIKGVMKEVGSQANQRFNAGKNFKELMKATTPSPSYDAPLQRLSKQDNKSKVKIIDDNTVKAKSKEDPTKYVESTMHDKLGGMKSR